MVTSKGCLQKANTDTWLTSLSVIQIILERSLVEKRRKQTNWGCGRNMSIYVYLLWSMFGLWFENILETWNSQIGIKYIAPWKETLFCRCHLVYKGEKKKSILDHCSIAVFICNRWCFYLMFISLSKISTYHEVCKAKRVAERLKKIKLCLRKLMCAKIAVLHSNVGVTF